MTNRELLQQVADVMRTHGVSKSMTDRIIAQAAERIDKAMQQERLDKMLAHPHPRKTKTGRSSVTDQQIEQAAELLQTTNMTAWDVALTVGISRATLYKYLQIQNGQIKYRASIHVGKKRMDLGVYNTLAEAKLAQESYKAG